MRSLGFIFFLAWRNVLRYRKRTLQNFLILFCGALCIMLVDAFMKGYAASSVERIVGVSGHLDVHATGYLESAEAMPLDLAIRDVDSVMLAMENAAVPALSPGTNVILAPSVETGCMLSNGELSRGALVFVTDSYTRIRPDGEDVINPMLSDVGPAIVEGRFYDSRGEPGAIVDEKYARKLGLSAGDPLILLGNDAYGSFSMMETSIIGIAREASLPGEAGCVVDLPGFARDFGLEGAATAISMWFVEDADQAGKAAGGRLKLAGSDAEGTAVQAVLDTLSGGTGLDPRPFSEISSTYAMMFDFLDSFFAGMMAVFALVACVGMTNSVLLSVQNRVKDLGTLRAIALTSQQASLLIYTETLITGFAASFCSLIVGAAVIRILELRGVGLIFELSDFGSALPDTIRPELFPFRLLAIAAMSAVFPVFAAILPAHTARNLTIRESLGG